MSLQLKLGSIEACGGAAAGSVDVLLDDIALLPRTDVFKRTTKYTKHTKSGGTTVAIAYPEQRYRSGIRNALSRDFFLFVSCSWGGWPEA
jgi:hypothetical protein